MALKNKLIAYIPIHLEYTEEKQMKRLLSELAKMEFGRSSGFYSSQKKKCNIKDIIIKQVVNGKKKKVS